MNNYIYLAYIILLANNYWYFDLNEKEIKCNELMDV